MHNNVLENSVEVKLKTNEDFLKIVETLTRIGVISETKKELYQSAHLLHKQGKYYIVSFKEMFLLDGKQSTLSEEDISRRNRIAVLLEEWGLLEIINKDNVNKLLAPISKVKIVSYKDKQNWTLVSKYNIGKKNVSKSVV